MKFLRELLKIQVWFYSLPKIKILTLPRLAKQAWKGFRLGKVITLPGRMPAGESKSIDFGEGITLPEVKRGVVDLYLILLTCYQYIFAHNS